MTVAAYLETDRWTRVSCTDADNPLPRFWITTGNRARVEVQGGCKFRGCAGWSSGDQWGRIARQARAP
jgi:hypothetical protein